MAGAGTDNRKTEVIILPDRAAVAKAAALRFVEVSQQAVGTHGRFSVALSGGSTPRDLYQLLATTEFSSLIEWSRVFLFWGDERAVSPDHPDSNYGMARHALISRVPVPTQNVNRILAELNPEDAAQDYERVLRQFFVHSSGLGVGREVEGTARFDLVLLGLGEDAHTASLFPHTAALHESERWVVANFVEKLNTYRITLTSPVLNSAKCVLFLVAGTEKADAVDAVLRGNYRPEEFPAQLVQPTDGRVVWLLDHASNQKLNEKS